MKLDTVDLFIRCSNLDEVKAWAADVAGTAELLARTVDRLEDLLKNQPSLDITAGDPS